MAYIQISDFKAGMDRRRPRTVGVPGSLWTLKNALISRGGDIVRAKKFKLSENLPAGTFGGYALRGQKYVFGSAASPVGLPATVQYQQLVAPSTPTMTAIVDVKAFDGKLYVAAEYDNGSLYHFYDGARVTEWDTVVTSAGVTPSDVARRLGTKIDLLAAVSAQVSGPAVIVTAATPGTAFTISGIATDGGGDTSEDIVISTSQANVAAVAEVRGTGTVEIVSGTSGPGVNRIASLTVNGVNMIAAPVDWATSHSATALLLSNAINNLTTTHGYTAEVSGATITLRAAVGTGATVNGYVVAVTAGGNVTVVTADIAGGVTEVEAVAQISKVLVSGTLNVADSFEVTINGTTVKTTTLAAGMGTALLVHKRRMWTLIGSLLWGCKLNTPTNWTDTDASIGRVFINISSESDGAQELIGLGVYQGNLAIYAREAVVIYSISTNASENAYVETVDNTGLIAPRSAISFGNTDSFYLDATGVRSLRARDGTNAAYKSDIGEAVDEFLQEIIDEVGESAAERAQAVIDPRDGRYMLAIGHYLIVLNYFPDSKIRAWSYIDFVDDIDVILRSKREVFVRSGDDFYQYGGADGSTYPDDDEFPVLVEMPFMDAKDPAAKKMLEGFDQACSGEWVVDVLVDPNNFDALVRVGTINRNTYHLPEAPLPAQVTHVAFRFTCTTAGDAKLSNMAVHFQKGKSG